MIERLTGTVVEQGENFLLLQVGPLGLKIHFLKVQGAFSPGEEVTIHTHLILRDDQLSLFGFLSRGDLEVFKELLKVNGVGPRLAQNIVSRVLPGELNQAVERNNPAPLMKVPGVGKKTALKILIALQEKTISPSLPTREWQEAFQALISLGFDRSEALERLNRLNLKGENLTFTQIIKEALKS
ncbi:MAG: Holliday junction branch migration protein RuvA [Caldiserica bacterium]|jgi:Holliday junction DNA helicase RuvA|nr:Holliday junction branch migration protein RuvA [Caldisericota bacterium]MDH7562942.1 Holliday junction branch migration protein RuvA [Caldisericota bacterium]